MFIELDRTFQQLSESVNSHGSDAHPLFPSGKHLRWHDLVGEYRVVVLSEAGSGKTEEIRNIARHLRLDRKAAFFIRLEHVSRDFQSAFEEGSYEEFERWRASDEEGWFLMDSVDEARLRDAGDFEAAVRRLGRLLVSAMQRVHIVITGRTSAWRPKTDLALCVNHLPFSMPSVSASNQKSELGSADEIRSKGSGTKNEHAAFKIVALDNLSADQIKIFSSAKGVTNTQTLLDAIERADAWSFTSRPQDLDELIEFWNDRGRIGSRLELMRNSIDRRLTERDQGRAESRPLSVEKVRLGAKLIAAAATMTHEQTIQVPDGANNMKGLAINSVLTDWNDIECATLLARPIFDKAIYGTVRFHHRSVREYLTAEWLLDLLKQETSRRKIEKLIFREQYGIEVIVPAMRPILPWLVIFDAKIRERTLRVAPEVIFEGGDPSQLPLETRRQILHQACDRLASGMSNRSMADFASVQRFASTDLAEDIRKLIVKFASNDDLLSFLLRMIWQGELVGALPEAKSVALSPASNPYTRVNAIRAVAAIGSPEDNAELRQSFVNESLVLNRDWLAEILKSATPSVVEIEWLFDCIQKIEDKKPYSVDNLGAQLASFVEQADFAVLPLFIKRVNKLLEKPPVVERRHCDISTRYAWLLEAAALVAERLVRERNSAALEPPSLSLLRKLSVAQQYGSLELSIPSNALEALVSGWPNLKLALFWYMVKQERK